MITANIEPIKKQKHLCCPICGSDKSEIIFRHARLANIKRTYATRDSRKKLITNLDTSLCIDCGMLYRMPLMTSEELDRYYRDSYYMTYNVNTSSIKNRDELTLWEKKYIKYFRFLERNKISIKNKRVLDAGCGKGFFLAAAQKRGAGECVGIEPSSLCCQKIDNKRYNFTILNKCIKAVSCEQTGFFDLIVCIGVLEHLSEPLVDLKVCRSLMNENGYMYFYTHNETPSLFSEMRKRISLVHQLYFTTRTIEVLLKKVGMEIIDIVTRNTDMHILARKSSPAEPEYKLDKKSYRLLKLQYQINKNIPSQYFTVASWFYVKYLALRNRLLYI
ncbi:MAG: Ubiquinone biosynthesis O-methyltransferase [Elusimicrobia bacterium ADurb.Bin231]|nr:MAG: Ubiquinone biosynthesis O-methyltransferase [Elusimicrobia bacterium ADurb.Bin231]